MVFVGLLGGASCERAASPPDYTTRFALASAEQQAPADRTCACADVNVFHLLLKDPKIPEADREFTIQIAAVFGPTLGITLSSLTILLFDNTFLLHS